MLLPRLRSLVLLATVLLTPCAAYAQESGDKGATEKRPTILFICEHGAAKSVIAAAYFDKLAKERGLNYRAVFRGTNPDPTLAESAAKGLKEDGIDTRDWKPVIVSEIDLKAASRVVALGCVLPGKDTVAGKLTEWNDIPSPSQNYQVARDDIVKRIQRLVDDLKMKEHGVKGRPTMIDFNRDKPGSPPGDFTTALTGQGKSGVWVVTTDSASPNPGNVLAQTDADATNYRFPLCVYDKLSAKDADVSVKFKAISGKKDQAAGIVWRYRDKDNYYIVRANALENNVVLYKVQNGKREDLPLSGEGRTYGKQTKVTPMQWNTLRVTAAGNIFTVYLNGEKLFEVEDSTFPDAGKVGLWTKADSVTYFDDLEVVAM
jgi:protein-tyrosine-phosphatase